MMRATRSVVLPECLKALGHGGHEMLSRQWAPVLDGIRDVDGVRQQLLEAVLKHKVRRQAALPQRASAPFLPPAP
jgi:hypothetical protein